MRCAGYNNVDLKTAQKYGIKVLRVPAILRKQLQSMPWHLLLLPTATPTKHTSNAVKTTLP